MLRKAVRGSLPRPGLGDPAAPAEGSMGPGPVPRGAPLAGFLWMAVASVLFAVMNLATRVAAQEVPWIEVAAARGVFGLLVALGVAGMRSTPLRIRNRRTAWIRSIAGTCAMLCTFYTLGAPSLALGDAATLGSLTAVFLALLAPRFLGEPSDRRTWAATLVAFLGAALVVGPKFHAAFDVACIAVFGALCSAIAMVMLRKLRSGESPEAIVAHFSAVAAVAMVALALPVWKTPGWGGAIWLALTGLCGGLAQIAMTRAYALENAAKVSTIGYLTVVLSHVFAAIGLGEKPGLPEAFGASLVIFAGVTLALRSVRAAHRQAASAVAGS